MPGQQVESAQGQAVEVVAGFDGSAGGVEVVVVRRTAGGRWFEVGTDRVVPDAEVARLTGRIGRSQDDTARGGEVGVPTGAELRDAVTSWIADYTGKDAEPLNLTNEQAELVAQLFAAAIRDGRIAVPAAISAAIAGGRAA
ncbi:hypothetical protein [Actinoplanes sp. URMC 104]|uniref:hypothetical protein n=1 Tax=Actinoplanes sp. URMC 104 TaxID=3423409 RepID=UPI003F1CA3C7